MEIVGIPKSHKLYWFQFEITYSKYFPFWLESLFSCMARQVNNTFLTVSVAFIKSKNYQYQVTFDSVDFYSWGQPDQVGYFFITKAYATTFINNMF